MQKLVKHEVLSVLNWVSALARFPVRSRVNIRGNLIYEIGVARAACPQNRTGEYEYTYILGVKLRQDEEDEVLEDTNGNPILVYRGKFKHVYLEGLLALMARTSLAIVRDFPQLCSHGITEPRNRAKCRRCGTIVESKSQHDFVSCRCGAIAVDGGAAYCRRAGKPGNFINPPPIVPDTGAILSRKPVKLPKGKAK